MTEDDRDPQQELNHEIRRALRHLYDPVYLQRSPLLFPLERGTLPVGQEVKTLRRILLDLVEELSPSDNVPLRSEKRRPHLALRGHYVEQRDVSAVAQELSLSERQLRRELRAGIEAMGRSFAMRYGPLNPSASTTLAQDVAEASLQAFRCQHSALDLAVEIRGVLNLLQSLCQERGISLATPRTCEPLLISSNRVILRQILLALYTTLLDCIHRAGGNALATHLEHDNASSRVTVGLAGDCPSDPSQLADQPWVDDDLLAMIDASLTYAVGMAYQLSLTLSLPRMPMRTLLIIDDTRSLHQLFARFLNAHPIFVRSAYDVANGLSSAIEHPPDAIILDIMMPERDGWEALCALRQHPSTQDIPIIVCTVLHQAELARSLSASGYLTKPVTQEALIRQLADLGLLVPGPR